MGAAEGSGGERDKRKVSFSHLEKNATQDKHGWVRGVNAVVVKVVRRSGVHKGGKRRGCKDAANHQGLVNSRIYSGQHFLTPHDQPRVTSRVYPARHVSGPRSPRPKNKNKKTCYNISSPDHPGALPQEKQQRAKNVKTSEKKNYITHHLDGW